MHTRFDQDTLDHLRLCLPDYCQAIGIDLRPVGRRLRGRCPVHEDRNPSFELFGDRHTRAGCYPCGWNGDVFDLARWTGRASTFPDAVMQVAGAVGTVARGSSPGYPPARFEPHRPMRRGASPTSTMPAGDVDNIRAARLRFENELLDRTPLVLAIANDLGISLETLLRASCETSGLGIAAPKGRQPWLCYAYPEGLKWRNPDRSGKPRFQWITGTATEPWRMGWLKPETERVLLTESESDALAIIEGDTDGGTQHVVVASPGTSFKAEWSKLFNGHHVVLCFDLDEAGRKATARVATLLQPFAREISTWRGLQ